MSRTYVITGSASGIGAAAYALLDKQGHRFFGVDIDDADVVVDLGTPDGRDKLVREVKALTGGKVDAVIANAGSARPEPFTVSVNYFGAIATLEGLRPQLLHSPAPRAVATASMAVLMDIDDDIVAACLAGDEPAALAAAKRTEDPQRIYASTKRALARWIRRNAPTAEWAGAGIPLNAVGPGVIVTPMVEPYLETEEGRAALARVPMPLHGFGSPDDVAALLGWLTSVENTLVTGQLVFIDGGSDVVLRGDDVWA
jgi:NAD(P)-dependent dehydrogenase (short-subunit alcohol dehydrogenase family)